MSDVIYTTLTVIAVLSWGGQLIIVTLAPPEDRFSKLLALAAVGMLVVLSLVPHFDFEAAEAKATQCQGTGVERTAQ